MRRSALLFAFALVASLVGCSAYDVLFGMFSSNYSSASPDNSSRYIEMRDEIDRWEQRKRQYPEAE